MISRRLLLLSAATPSRPLRALIVDGMNNHDWQAGTRAIRHILEASGRFTVEISTTPAAANDPAWAGWRPNFGAFDVVINNFNGGHLQKGTRWPHEVESSLDRYVGRGGGLVIFHAANNAFFPWTRYNEMIGLGWREPAYGPGLVLDERGRQVIVPPGTGPRPGHGPRHDFVVTTRDPRHAITRGFPEEWLHPAEQLTHGQHGPIAAVNEIRVLTYALSKDSGRREPMDWVRRWQRGRIYTTMFGHTWPKERNPNVRCTAFGALLVRGTEWAATGRVTIPLPARLPSRTSMELDKSVPAE